MTEVFTKHGFILGRMISGSKSGYRQKYPDNLIFFNANIITKEDGKVWYGDLDITKDESKLKEVAKEIGKNLYVLYEMDARFGNEALPVKKLIKLAKYVVKND